MSTYSDVSDDVNEIYAREDAIPDILIFRDDSRDQIFHFKDSPLGVRDALLSFWHYVDQGFPVTREVTRDGSAYVLHAITEPCSPYGEKAQ